MKLQHLQWALQLLERYEIRATQLTIKGKDSNVLSFTCPRSQWNKLTTLAGHCKGAVRTSMDIFIPKSQMRVQFTLPKRKMKL